MYNLKKAKQQKLKTINFEFSFPPQTNELKDRMNNTCSAKVTASSGHLRPKREDREDEGTLGYIKTCLKINKK